ncbi:MAG: c-type cytochrome [Arenicella sp.]
MKYLIIIVSFFVLLGNASAADINAGKAKAVSCVGCHGSNGISTNPEWPNLAGQQEKYLSKQLKAFRDGQRNDSLMSPMAAALSDDDIANISAYYSNL